GWRRAANNLGVCLERDDRPLELLALSAEGADRALRRGDRDTYIEMRMGAIRALASVGEWDEALARVAEARDLEASPFALVGVVDAVAVLCERGDVEAGAAIVEAHAWQREAEQVEIATGFAAAEARLLRSRMRFADALAAAERGLAERAFMTMGHRATKDAFAEACEAAFELGDAAKVRELLALVDDLQPGERTPLLDGQRARFGARLDAAGDGEDARELYAAAVHRFADAGFVFLEAATLLEESEWLVARDRPEDARPLLDRARATFERLGAGPWLDRAENVLGAQVPA